MNFTASSSMTMDLRWLQNRHSVLRDERSIFLESYNSSVKMEQSKVSNKNVWIIKEDEVYTRSGQDRHEVPSALALASHLRR